MYTRHTTSPLESSGGWFEIVAANGDRIQGHYTATGRYISDTQVLARRRSRSRRAAAGLTLRVARSPPPSRDARRPDLGFGWVSWTLEGTVHY
jgi:hypothetical protein